MRGLDVVACSLQLPHLSDLHALSAPANGSHESSLWLPCRLDFWYMPYQGGIWLRWTGPGFPTGLLPLANVRTPAADQQPRLRRLQQSTPGTLVVSPSLNNISSAALDTVVLA